MGMSYKADLDLLRSFNQSGFSIRQSRNARTGGTWSLTLNAGRRQLMCAGASGTPGTTWAAAGDAFTQTVDLAGIRSWLTLLASSQSMACALQTELEQIEAHDCDPVLCTPEGLAWARVLRRIDLTERAVQHARSKMKVATVWFPAELPATEWRYADGRESRPQRERVMRQHAQIFGAFASDVLTEL